MSLRLLTRNKFRRHGHASETHYALRTTHYVSHPPSLIYWLSAALVLSLFYLAVSIWGFGVAGFPLDDAWIHQTYARNLAYSGQLAFVPGVPSAGSTAPLWSFLLSLGYLGRIPFQIWTYGLGILFLGLTGWTVARLGTRLFPARRWVGLGAGLFCIFEWHHVWAALSGMETILFIWLSVFLVERYFAYQPLPPPHDLRDHPATTSPRLPSFLSLGLLGGLLTLTRPEGLGLVGLIALDMAYRQWGRKPARRIRLFQDWFWLAAGVGLLLLPYVAFHLWTTGLPFPNTLYAKQAEYGVILQAIPLWRRLFGNLGPTEESVQGVFRVIFIGPQLLLLPGLAFAAWLMLKERRFDLVLIWLWWMSYLVLYALRLPVTYQHGRYQIPAIIWVILLGVWGTSRLLGLERSYHNGDRNLGELGRTQGNLGHVRSVNKNIVGQRSSVSGHYSHSSSVNQPLLRIVRRVIVLSLVVLLLGFTVLGAQAYGRDVRFIESEMVATAKWLNEHTAPNVLIAAHDIGAIGYFTQRPLIDLAGLVTPEIIPIIRDEGALFDFIIRRQADYIVTFPAWYPELTQQAELSPLYSTNAPWALQAGGDNMVVYQVLLLTQP